MAEIESVKAKAKREKETATLVPGVYTDVESVNSNQLHEEDKPPRSKVKSFKIQDWLNINYNPSVVLRFRFDLKLLQFYQTISYI